jgi:hypothetical protein
MNIKRGLKRLWVVGSVLWIIGVIGVTIVTFPEQPKEKTELEKEKEQLIKELDERFIDKNKTEETKQYDKDVEALFNDTKLDELIELEKYEKKKEKSLLILLTGLGGLILMWGSLYTGIWISSGFSSDKKKDETDEN